MAPISAGGKNKQRAAVCAHSRSNQLLHVLSRVPCWSLSDARIETDVGNFRRTTALAARQAEPSLMRTAWLNAFALAAVAIAITLVVITNLAGYTSTQLLNVSYDPTRELFRDLNQQFVEKYFTETGRKLTIQQSHGGSSRQTRAVMDGAPADVVTLASPSDVDALCKRGLIADGWAERLPNNSQPYTSTIVFVVRKGNPKHIRDWPDNLIASGVEIVTPDPKTSGNGKLSALAAWGAIVSRGGTATEAVAYLRSFYAHAPVLDQGARGAAVTFAV